MHRSRLGIFLFDYPSNSHDMARDFWAAALGMVPCHDPAEADDAPYLRLGDLAGVRLELQRLGEGAPRIHPDIETDDVRAEIARLTGLGATIETDAGRFAIMKDPAGLVFCVVPVQTGALFEQHAQIWD